MRVKDTLGAFFFATLIGGAANAADSDPLTVPSMGITGPSLGNATTPGNSVVTSTPSLPASKPGPFQTRIQAYDPSANRIGYVGKLMADPGNQSLFSVGSENVGQHKIIVREIGGSLGTDLDWGKPISVIASASLNGEVYAILDPGGGADYELWALLHGSTNKIAPIADKPVALAAIDDALGAGLIVLSEVLDGKAAYPRVTRLSIDGKNIWSHKYKSQDKPASTIGNQSIGSGLLSPPGGSIFVLGHAGDVVGLPWVIKLDASSGLPTWEGTYAAGGVKGEFVAGVVAADGLVFVGTAQVPGRSTNDTDLLAIKIGFDGAILWIRLCGGLRDEIGKSIIQRQDGSFLLGGGSQSKEPAQTGSSEMRPWVLELDNNGWLNWETSIGLGGTVVGLYDRGSSFLAIGDRRQYDSIERTVVPAFAADRIDWDAPYEWHILKKFNNGGSAPFAEEPTTCIDPIVVSAKDVQSDVIEPGLTDSRVVAK